MQVIVNEIAAVALLLRNDKFKKAKGKSVGDRGCDCHAYPLLKLRGGFAMTNK